MDKAQAVAALKKYGSQAKAAKALGIARQTLQHHLKKLPEPSLDSRPGRSLAEFRAAHDKNFIVPQKIKAALKALGDGWEYEAQFIRLAGLSQTEMSTFRSLFEEDHVVVVDRTKRVWAGTKAVAAKLREMVS